MTCLGEVIQASLRKIYDETYAQYRCARIVAINERVTHRDHPRPAETVDAVHGAVYFELTIGLLHPDGAYVELALNNAGVPAEYELTGFRKGNKPAGYRCPAGEAER